MLLRYEQGVEAPETGFDKRRCRHLEESIVQYQPTRRGIARSLYVPHFQENVPDLFSHFQQGVERSTIRWDTFSFKVVLLERGSLP